MHVGGGDLPALLETLGVQVGSADEQPAFVVLLQEAYREGAAVPLFTPAARSASHIMERPPNGDRRDIVEQARELGLWAAYVPSMRNGAEVREDRGNAILSNLPLSDVEAIELPEGRQRRVAVAAVLTGRTGSDAPWRLRVASVHLENRADVRRLWIFAGGVRAAQARAAVGALDGEAPAVLGGDFNSWSGFDELAYRETARLFPDTPLVDRRPTFSWGRRLDHLFFRLPAGWRARFARLDERLGSDHYPLAGAVDVGVGGNQ
jgi:endonuclease/exonuclease/phosphatase family metal-dependent hydrolase